MKEEGACKTPIQDRLRSIPGGALLEWKSDSAWSLVPVGKLCNEAAEEIDTLRAEVECWKEAYSACGITGFSAIPDGNL